LSINAIKTFIQAGKSSKKEWSDVWTKRGDKEVKLKD
jgi:hypothetical protein